MNIDSSHRVWMIRHGESTANAGAVTAEYASIPLTGRGRAQAGRIAEACPEAPDWIGRSSFLRARQTAEPFIARHPEAELVELSVHEFDYLGDAVRAGTDSEARRPFVDAYWSRMDPDHRDGDDAESFADLHDRARSFLDDAADRPGFGVVFTHEQFIRAVLLTVMYPDAPTSPGLMRRFFGLRTALPIPNAAVVRLRREDGRWWSGGVDTSHLAVAPAVRS